MLRRGLISGLQTGLKRGLNPFGAVADPLALELDFRTPNGPARSAGPTIAGVTATAAWRLDEGSGNFVDEIGGVELTAGGITRRSMIGLWSGSDFYSMQGGRFAAGAFDATAPDNAFLDQGASDSFAGISIFKSNAPSGNGANTLLGKQQTTGSAGWVLLLNGSSRGRFVLHDGTSQVQLNHNGDHNDGAWHFLAWVVDRTTDTMTVFSDVNTTPTSASVAAIGSPSIAHPFKIGRAANYSGAAFDCAYVAVWEGAACEALGQSDFESIFDHAVVPDGASDLDVYTRASAAAPIVGNESGFGVRVANLSSGQFAHAYRSAFSHSSDLGMLVEPPSTNQVIYSEFDSSETGWTNQGANFSTFDGGQGTAPDGTNNSVINVAVVAGVRGEMRTSSAFTVTASQPHTISFFARSDDGTPPGVGIFFDGTDYSAATTGITLTNEWARYSFTATPGGSSTNLELQITGPNQSAQFWGVVVEQGSSPTSYIRTSGATASRVRTEPIVTDLLANNYLDHARGAIEIVYVPDVDHVADQYYWRVQPQSGNADRKLLRSNNGGNFLSNDGAAATAFDLDNGSPTTKSAGVEYERMASWDSAETPCATNRVDADTDTGGSPYTAGATEADLYIGNANVANFEIEGVISLVRIYTEPQV